MNYGPLCRTIDSIIWSAKHGTDEQIRKLRIQLQKDQDDFYKDVKSGRLICEEFDEELKGQ
jgi:hypothetical protein